MHIFRDNKGTTVVVAFLWMGERGSWKERERGKEESEGERGKRRERERHVHYQE